MEFVASLRSAAILINQLFYPRICCRYNTVRPGIHLRHLLRLLHSHCTGGRARVFFLLGTALLLGIVLFAPVTLLAFSFLDSFVRMRCERAYLKRWWTIITRDERVQDLERRVLSFPIHLGELRCILMPIAEEVSNEEQVKRYCRLTSSGVKAILGTISGPNWRWEELAR